MYIVLPFLYYQNYCWIISLSEIIYAQTRVSIYYSFMMMRIVFLQLLNVKEDDLHYLRLVIIFLFFWSRVQDKTLSNRSRKFLSRVSKLHCPRDWNRDVISFVREEHDKKGKKENSRDLYHQAKIRAGRGRSVLELFLSPLFLLAHSLVLEYLRYALTAKHTWSNATPFTQGASGRRQHLQKKENRFRGRSKKRVNRGLVRIYTLRPSKLLTKIK